MILVFYHIFKISTSFISSLAFDVSKLKGFKERVLDTECRKDSEQTKQIEDLQKQNDDLADEKERLLEEIERILSETGRM